MIFNQIFVLCHLYRLLQVFSYSLRTSQTRARRKLYHICVRVLRASPWEHQAGMLHAISPISMKLCQFKRSTPKLEKTNLFVFWIFQGGDRPPPWIYHTFTMEIASNWAKYMKLSVQLNLTYCFEGVHTYWYIPNECKEQLSARLIDGLSINRGK